MSEDGPERPAVRRVGRRRVATAEADGVVPRLDPTYDDRPGPDGTGSDGTGSRGTPPGGNGSCGAAQADSARDRWLRDQRPPHWG